MSAHAIPKQGPDLPYSLTPTFLRWHAREKNGLRQGQNLALAVLFWPNSLGGSCDECLSFSFSPLVSSLELSNTTIYEPYLRALLGTASHVCVLA